MRLSATFLAIGVVLAAARPTAAEAADEGTPASPLGRLSADDRRTLAPYLAQGTVGLVEFATRTELPAVLVATRVHAPARRIASVIGAPEGYPDFMPLVDTVDVVARRNRTLAYEWSWRKALFTFSGTHVMSMFRRSRERGHPRLDTVIEVRSRDGDLGDGRLVWRIYATAPRESLLVLATRNDMRNANYVAQKLTQGGNSINRSINISLAFVMLAATKHEAEQRAGHEGAVSAAPGDLHRPDVDLHALAPLLLRGDLFVIETDGARLRQVSVVGRMGRPRGPVHDVMTRPQTFGRSLVDGSEAKVVEQDDDRVVFDWSIPLPLVGSSGRMRLVSKGERIGVDAVSGALSGGTWRFETRLFPWRESVVVGWARFDPADTSWLLRRLVDGIPSLRPGLAAATQIMVLRSVRARVAPAP